MKVALINLTSGGLSGGYRKYLRVMIPLLRANGAIQRVDVYSPEGLEVSDDWAKEGHLRWPASDAFFGYRSLKRMVEQNRPDVVFFPTARWMNLSCPSVVMVHNMEPLIIPFSPNSPVEILRNLLRRYAARRSISKATRVIAVSKFVRDYITETWREPRQKIDVIYHGIDEGRSNRYWSKTSPAAMPASDPPFLLTVGSIRPARGLEDLLEALKILAVRGIRLPLRIVGGGTGSLRYAARLRKIARRGGVNNQITWTGNLDPEALPDYYENCAAFVMTTRVEACPMTALEAMTHGALCVSSDALPMPEFFRGSAIYYRGGDGAHLAEVLEDILCHAPESRRVEYRSSARARAEDFPWAETADATVQCLLRAADQHPASSPTSHAAHKAGTQGVE